MEKERPSDFDFQRALKGISGTEEDARVAFKELHNFFGTTIYVVSKKFLKSPELANDLVQEVFTKVWIKRKELNHVLDFEGYLIGITKNEALGLLRKAIKAECFKREHLEMVDAQKYDPIKEEYANQLDHLVEQLPPRRKEVIKLKIQGFKAKEISERLKITVLNVHKHIYKATRFINERKHDVISLLLPAIVSYSIFCPVF
jgi:RNA polymerase sigma factor (sigma-70 family)